MWRAISARMGYRNKSKLKYRRSVAKTSGTLPMKAGAFELITYRFGSGNEVLHMPDAHRRVVREIDPSLHRKEAVDFALRAELGAEAFHVHGCGRG